MAYDKVGVGKYQCTFKGRASRLCISAKRRAKELNLEYDLDANWVASLLPNGCSQTGVPFVLTYGNGQGYARTHDLAPSLDKIDPAKGYTKDNVQVVTWIYNRAKLQSTDGDVLAFARALVAAHGG